MCVRVDALAVIAAFLIGIGPGSPVQPCPKHWAAHGDEPAPRTAASHEADGAATHPDERPDHAHAESAGATGHPASHSGGPCDCLGTCLTCCGPALVASALRSAAAAAVDHTPPGTPPLPRPMPDVAAYLRPLAQPPPV